MILHVRPGRGSVIATHVGQGDQRRALYITPAGCSLDAPPGNLGAADLSLTSYDVDPGPALGLLQEALKDEGHALRSRAELREGQASRPAAARAVTRK